MTSQIATVGQIAASAGGSSTPSASVIMAEASAGTQHVLKKASSSPSNPPQPSISSSPPEVRPTPTHHSVLISLTSGAMAGAVAKTVIAPLDRTKIYFQTHPERSYRLKRAFKYIHTTYQTQVRHNLINNSFPSLMMLNTSWSTCKLRTYEHKHNTVYIL